MALPGPVPFTVPLPTWFPLRWQLEDGLHGTTPLPWCSGGWYAGALREQLLALRRGATGGWDQLPVDALLLAMASLNLPSSTGTTLLLVPIPSGQRRPNPLPLQLAQHLAQRLMAAQSCQLKPELLQRRCRLAAQHRLGRRQRWRNQWLSFRALLAPARDAGTALLVDDVLTSGATALAARHALESAGWNVAGLLCLARTPRQQSSSRGRA